ncbi:MAG: sel1 repeat family protein [Alteromonadaceae bacterium]|nr:sel1 repeat family protein [Alteromonadaceae bacterium]
MDDSNSNTIAARTHQFSPFNNAADPYKKIRLLLVACIAVIALSCWFYDDQQVAYDSDQFISHPKVGDIYYLDFRLFSDNLRPSEKFRFAKVIDITGNIVTLFYGNFFYLNEKSMFNSIRYGHFRYKKYFSTYRNNFTRQQIVNLKKSNAIFKVERPINNKLHGNFVKPQQTKITNNTFIAGKQENITGNSYLKATNINNHLQLALKYFKQSAQLNYPQGQINLAQMYLREDLEQQDLTQALYWLKQASLQSNKSAINKYTIVCQQIENCDINDFYQDLIDAGVNIRFNKTNMPKFRLN